MFSARFLLGLFDSVYSLALVGWVGAISFFSFGVAPIIFKILQPGDAARFVRALFPRYYLWGAISAAIALPAMLGVPLSYPEYRGPLVGLQALMIIAGALIMLYCGNSLTPAINTARDGGPESAPLFDRLHKRSVRLNAVSLLLGVLLIVAHATRPAPVTEGIQEKSPVDRMKLDREVIDELDRLIRNKPVDSEKSGSLLDDEGRKELRDIIEAKRKRDEEKKKARQR